MQQYCAHTGFNFTLHRPFLGSLFRPEIRCPPPSPSPSPSLLSAPRVSCRFPPGRRRVVRARKKDNVWSIDNDVASTAPADEKTRGRRRRGERRRRRGNASAPTRARNSTFLVSAAMLVETEDILQTQEPVIKPAWNTFSSSVSGIWKGVGAVFSPFTAEMEPVGLGNQNENLYDCYTLSLIEKVPSDSLLSHILRRKTNCVALNPFGEIRNHAKGGRQGTSMHRFSAPENVTPDLINTDLSLPSYDSFDFETSETLEEDFMSVEPGLVFFEDGSYSRGPVNIPVGGSDDSKYFLSPIFKFEQCLVKGCHKRLRIVHTIEFNEGGSSIQIIRIAIYEERWVSPVNISVGNDDLSDLKPISQRRRTQPAELTGSWKVFEVSATPIFSEEMTTDAGPPYVYLCTETLKKRRLPGSSAYFGEEEMLDLQDVTVLWLPGGVTAYVDVSKDGTLSVGVGWYSDEGINLVMDRDYGLDGKLKEVRWKSEVKRWADASSLL